MQKIFLKRLVACALACLLLPGSLPALTEEETDLGLMEEEAGIEEISSAETYPAYLDRACVLLAQPAANAAILAVLPSGSPVLVMARQGEYVRVNVQLDATENSAEPRGASAGDSLEAFQVREEAERDGAEDDTQVFREPVVMQGYVPLETLAQPKTLKPASRLCYAVETAVMYAEAHEHAHMSRYLPMGRLVQVDGISGPFSHIKGMDAYVYTSALKKLNAKAVKATVGFGSSALPLYGMQAGKPVPLGVEVPANTLLTVEWAYRDWYCVFYEDSWGLIAQKDIQKLMAERLPVSVAAVLREGMPLMEEPLASGQPSWKTVHRDTPIWVNEIINGYVAVAIGGEMLFAPYAELRVIGEMKKVAQYEGYVEWNAALLDFPDAETGSWIGEALANSLVKINAQTAGYAMIESDGEKMYIATRDFVSLDELFADPDRLENYHILIDKAERELTVFLADAQGNPTNTILQQAKVAIGRKTMPTPVGTFTLGHRQRWRSFPPRFAPFAIQFAAWNRKLFIHGPMCFHPDESAMSRNALLEFGQQKTSGCVRVPYDVMLWIYCHCGPDNTVVEITGGQS